FELLTGQVPFNDSRPMEVLLGHIQQSPPSLRSLRPDLPAAVEQVVIKVLAKNPADRYATAGALARALIAAWPATSLQSIHGQPTTFNLIPPVASGLSALTALAPTLRPAWQRYIRAGLALVTLLALLLVIVALFFTGLPEGRAPDSTPTTII